MKPVSSPWPTGAAGALLLAAALATSPIQARYAWESDAGLAAEDMAAIQGLLETQRYADAVALLQQAPLPASADWNNLMGYSLRKMTPPDLDRAEQFYQAALRIEPAHTGALAYYGELLMQRKDRAGALALLARLRSACPAGCDALGDLQRAVDASPPAQGTGR